VTPCAQSSIYSVGDRVEVRRALGRASKAVALIWYRALTWYSLRLSPPRTHFEPCKAVGTRGGGLPYCPVTSRGSSGAPNDRAGEEYQVRARYQIRANALL